MLSAADRVILGHASRGGYVSERDLTRTQVRTAGDLVHRGLLKNAGQEADRTKVYGITGAGRQAYGEAL